MKGGSKQMSERCGRGNEFWVEMDEVGKMWNEIILWMQRKKMVGEGGGGGRRW